MALRRSVGLLLLLGATLQGAMAAEVAADALEPAKAAIRTREFAQARQLLLPQANAANAEARYLLACLHLNGLPGEPDRSQARRWLELAAAQGHGRAALALAALLAGNEPDEAAAGRWLQEAQRLGVPEAEAATARGALPLAFRPATDLADPQARAEALWRAAAAGEVALLASLAGKAELALVDAFGRDALAHAAAAGQVSAMRLLLERGAARDVRDRAGMTALMLAAQSGSADAVELLLGPAGSDLQARDVLGNTALMYAAASGSLPAVEKLLAGGAVVSVRNEQEWTALDFARVARAQGPAIAARLEALRAPSIATAPAPRASGVRRAVDGDAYSGWPDLAVAAARRDPAMVVALVAAGADPDAVLVDGATALHVAVRAHAPRTVEALLAAGADATKRDRNGDTPLLLAVRNDDADSVRQLLARGARDDAGRALLAATTRARPVLVQALLGGRTEINATDEGGRTALMLAAGQADARVARMLLDAGADATRTDAAGRTAAWHAAQAGQGAVLELLASCGAPLDRADGDGLTPLAVAAAAGQPATVKVLLGTGAAVDARDAHQATPLHLAAAGGHDAVARQLLEAGADKDAQDAWGDTPLMVAVRSGSDATVAVLLQAGASRRLRNREKASAADIAQARSLPRITRLLDEKR